MEFGCSSCEYTSSQKISIIRHINKRKSCGSGTKEIIEIPIVINCEFCNKKFSTKSNLNEHLKNNCKQKNTNLQKQLKEANEKIKELEKRPTVINQNVQNIQNIVIINNYEDTKIDKLTDKMYNKIINGADEVYQIIPRLIKHIHFNPDIPENHNICISNRNKNNKHLEVYRNQQWEIDRKDNEIDNLINDKETNLSDWIDEKGEKYPEAMERFNEYLEQKYDDDTVRLVKEQVELILYNNRNMIKQSH